MPNRTRAEAEAFDDDLESEGAPAVKKPRKRRKPSQRKRLRGTDDIPSKEAESADGGGEVVSTSVAVAAEAALPEAPGPDAVWSDQPVTSEPGIAAAPTVPDASPRPVGTKSSHELENAIIKAEEDNGELPMNEDLKQHVRARDTWIRFIYMILFGAVFYVGQFVVGLVAVVQFVLKLLTGKPHARLVAFGAEMAVFYREIVEFLTFHSERVPFPFSPWPHTASSGRGTGSDAREAVPN
jgi:hypothetical protein